MIHNPLQEQFAIVCFFFFFEMCVITGLARTAFTRNAFGTSCCRRGVTSYLQMRVEGKFSTATKFAAPAVYGGGASHLATLNSCVAPEQLMPEFSVCELVDVAVEFVFPSESGVTYLSNPRLITTQETVRSICIELVLISIRYLPYCRVTCTSSAGSMTVLSLIILIGWH